MYSRAGAGWLLAALLLVGCEFGGEPDVSPRPQTVEIALTTPGDLDPAHVRSEGGLALISAACDPLLARGGPAGEVEPSLVENWSSDATARIFTFRLRETTFHDGAPVDAKAILANLNRVAHPATDSPWASLLDVVEGYRDVRAGDSRTLRGLRDVDARSFEVELSRPDADFPRVMAHPSLTPVSPAGLDEGVSAALPVCSGPFEFVGDAEEGRIVLRSIDDPPVVLEARLFETVSEAYDAFGAGEVAAAEVPQALAFEVNEDPGHRVRFTPTITYLGLHVGAPVTGDIRIRRAVSLALDRVLLIDASFGDGRDPARGWLTTEDPPRGCLDNAKRIGDPEAARRSLASVGVEASRITLPLRYRPDVVPEVVVDALGEQLSSTLGIAVSPVPLEPEEFRDSLRQRPPEGLWIQDHAPEVPGSWRALAPLFGSEGEGNFFGYADDSVDRAINEARRSLDPTSRLEVLREAEGEVCEDLPAIPLWHGAVHWVFDEDSIEVPEVVLDGLGVPILRDLSPGP